MRQLPDYMVQSVIDRYSYNKAIWAIDRLSFMYNKFHKGKNEFWARQIEDQFGFSYDFHPLDFGN